MQVKVIPSTKQRVTVKNFGGVLTGTEPITIRNQVVEITSIENIADVGVVDKVAGATLVYNPSNLSYEVKQLTYNNIAGNIDCGTF